jgi:hypothetical protein
MIVELTKAHLRKEWSAQMAEKFIEDVDYWRHGYDQKHDEYWCTPQDRYGNHLGNKAGEMLLGGIFIMKVTGTEMAVLSSTS